MFFYIQNPRLLTVPFNQAGNYDISFIWSYPFNEQDFTKDPYQAYYWSKYTLEIKELFDFKGYQRCYFDTFFARYGFNKLSFVDGKAGLFCYHPYKEVCPYINPIIFEAFWWIVGNDTIRLCFFDTEENAKSKKFWSIPIKLMCREYNSDKLQTILKVNIIISSSDINYMDNPFICGCLFSRSIITATVPSVVVDTCDKYLKYVNLNLKQLLKNVPVDLSAAKYCVAILFGDDTSDDCICIKLTDLSQSLRGAL